VAYVSPKLCDICTYFLFVASYHKKTFSYVSFTPEKTDVVDADAPKKLQVGFLLSEYRFLA
jgi:hypothetical protein